MTPSELFQKAPNRWAYATWMDGDRGYLFVETPKVACTKVKCTLQDISGYVQPPNQTNIHYRRNGEFVGSVMDYIDRVDALLAQENFLSFCFVRHPESRMRSGFRDKIQNSPGKFWQVYRDSIRARFGLQDDGDITFAHFVRWVQETPDGQRDIHWRSQTALTAQGVIPYDFIGRQEHFARDFRKVLERLNVPDAAERAQGRENSSDAASSRETPPELVAVIEDIYAVDYETFGY